MKYRIVETIQGGSSLFMPQKSEDGETWKNMSDLRFTKKPFAEKFLEEAVQQTVIHEYNPSTKKQLLG